MSLKITGKKASRVVPERDRHTDRLHRPVDAVTQSRFDRHAHEDVLLLLALAAMAVEARRTLVDVIGRRRKIEAQLADPELADHPKRPRAERTLTARWEAERQAVIRLAEVNCGISRTWARIPAGEKVRFGLTTLLGEPDPTINLGHLLWADDRGLGLFAPLPADWSIPHDIAHKATEFDHDPEIRTFDVDELLTRDQPSF